MSNFRDAQKKAHPNKSNTLISALIIIQVLNISIQTWLLYTGLNNALENNKSITWPAFFASLFLFLISFCWLYFLPMGTGKEKRRS